MDNPNFIDIKTKMNFCLALGHSFRNLLLYNFKSVGNVIWFDDKRMNNLTKGLFFSTVFWSFIVVMRPQITMRLNEEEISVLIDAF